MDSKTGIGKWGDKHCFEMKKAVESHDHQDPEEKE